MTSKKSLIKIICVIFLMIFSIGLVGGFIGSIAKKGDTDDVLNSEEPKEEPVFIDRSDVLLLNHEYNTSSGVVTVVSETSDFYISDSGNKWILLPVEKRGDDTNILDIIVPLHSSGQYSLTFSIYFDQLWSSCNLAYSSNTDNYDSYSILAEINIGNGDDLNFNSNENVELDVTYEFDFDSRMMYASFFSNSFDDQYVRIPYLLDDVSGEFLHLIFDNLDESSSEYITFSNFSYTKGLSVDSYLVDENGV